MVVFRCGVFDASNAHHNTSCCNVELHQCVRLNRINCKFFFSLSAASKAICCRKLAYAHRCQSVFHNISIRPHQLCAWEISIPVRKAKMKFGSSLCSLMVISQHSLATSLTPFSGHTLSADVYAERPSELISFVDFSEKCHAWWTFSGEL